MEDLIAEVADRLNRLSLVASPTVEATVESLREASGEDLHYYLEFRLPWIEAMEEEAKGYPHVLAFAARMANLTDQASVMKEFGLEEYNWMGWARVAKEEVDSSRLAFCVANLTAMMTFNFAGAEQQRAIQAAQLFQEARWLLSTGCAEAAVERIERWLELTPETYREPGLSEHLKDRFDGASMETAVQIMDALADGLYKTKREDDLRRSLEAFLGIDDELYNERYDLERHLEQLRAGYIKQTIETYDNPEITESSELLSGRFSLTYFFAELMRAISWCLHRQGASERGVTLFGAFLGIWPDSVESFATLRRRIANLGEDEVFQRLESWVALVKRSGRRDALRETFAVEFGAVPSDDARAWGRVARPCERWSNGDGNAAALLMRAIVASLNRDAPDEVAPLYLRCAGISEDDIRARSYWLGRWLDEVSPGVADPLVLAIAASYSFTGRLNDLVNLLEVHFDIESEDYKTTKLRTILRERQQGRPLDRKFNMAVFVLWSLGLFLTNRVVEAYFLIPEFYPGLTGPDEIFGPFLADLKELPADFGEFGVYITARTLHFAGYIARACRLIEAHLGIEDADFEGTQDAFAKKLRGDGTRDSKHVERFIQSLAQSLTFDGRPRQSVAMIEAYLGIDADTYDDYARLRERVRALTPDALSSLPPIWALSQTLAGAGDRGLRVLEAVLGLETLDDYTALDLPLRFSRSVVSGELASIGGGPEASEWMRNSTLIDFVGALLTVLESAEERAKREATLESLCRDKFWLDRAWEGGLIQSVFIAAEVLVHLLDRDPVGCLEVCSRGVQLLRNGSNLAHLSAVDRLRLAQFTSFFRRQVVAVGNSITLCEADPERAEELRRQFLCWDAELGQRVVLERFLYATPAAGWDGAEEPVPHWTCQGRLLHSWPSPNAAPLACFELRVDASAATTQRLESAVLPRPSIDSEDLVESLRTGVQESRLAEVLGDEQLLLRAGFTSAGQLVWSLFKRDGDRLRTTRHGFGRDGDNARERIADAVRRHDETIRTAWERLRLAQKWDHLASLVKLPVSLMEKADWPAIGKWATRLVERLDEFRITFVRDRLRQRFPGFGMNGPETSLAIDPEDWSAFWDDMAAERLDSQGIEEKLDQATSALLEEVADIWPQDELAAALPDQEVALIVQAEDVLFSVPIAFLKHGDRFLFERVRSVRSVLSLALLDWLGESDWRALRDTLDDPDRVLSLSWFKNDDLSARQGAERLHRGHREFSRSRRRGECEASVEWYSAADQPRGTHACLAKGLETHGAFRVVSVCGHGRGDLSGIELGDGIWNGSSLIEKVGNDWRERSACDLLGIELLIQVSCSIGRVRQTEMQDVEGFCVELAVNRARSVLAGLWPLHSEHSPAFANRVAGHYLRLRSETIREAKSDYEILARDHPSIRDDRRRTMWVANRLSGSCLRARAVTAARLEWLAGFRQGRGFVGLNTAAALELFGVG
jgi:hypothetical protein